MRRNSLLLFVGAVAVFAASCSDAVVEPTRSTEALSASTSPSLSRNHNNSSERTVIGTIDLSPAGGTYHVGDFDVVIPAGAVCDPRKTKYGVKHWDDDCSPAKGSVTVDVVARTQKGQVSVDFQPDLRFRPSAGWVRIETRAYRDLLKSDGVHQLDLQSPYFNQFAIFYVPTGTSSGIDELRSTGDASMVTHVNLSTGVVWRRVKHFSGYLISSGYKCDPNQLVDGSCQVDAGLGGEASFMSTTAFSLSSVLVTP